MNKTRNIRFGTLEPHVAATAARSGMTISAWVRQAIAATLHERPDNSVTRQASSAIRASDAGERRRCVLRMSAADLERWKAEALEHELALTRYIELQMSVTPERNHRIAAVLNDVRRATVELAAVGRNLNQLARSWNTYPGKSSAREREQLAQHCADVDRLSAQLSHLVADMNARRGARRRAPT